MDKERRLPATKILEMRCLLDEVNEKGEPLLRQNERDFLEKMAIFVEEYHSATKDMSISITKPQRDWIDDMYEKYNDYLEIT